ncbi:MAG TPA: ABC transporter substrate-binding protein [Ktedonobacteraceae bacterium]|nr:ABC transporter substrate-binding protein [Ktedonobacteraceae bacterium]
MAFQLHKPIRGMSRFFKTATLLCVAAVMVVFLAACGGSGSGNTSSSRPLVVVTAPGQYNVDFFNPFNSANQGSDWGAQGLLYEELYFTSTLDGSTHPWLATSYQYSDNNSVLTFHLRSGVNWNDGKPLTSADVVYTFNLMKQYPDLDHNALWTNLIKSVSAPDDSTVVFTLQHPDSTALFYIGDGVFIVPQHIWSNLIAGVTPDKYQNDDHPVGTGPYELSSFNSDLIVYTANPHYWGGEPAVKEIEVPAVKDNTTAVQDMAAGQYDWTSTGWSGQYSSIFEGKNPSVNHVWFAASNTVMLYLNLTKAPFNNLNFRKAVNAAIDRSQLPQGVAQYAPVANPTGVKTTFVSKWVAPQYQNLQYPSGQNLVDQYMKAAGFVKNGSYYQYANGQPFSMSVDVVNGWSDWDQDVQFIVNDLNKAGIKASVNSESGYTPYYTAISTGQYDAAISWTDNGPTPYYAYHDLLESSLAATKTSPAGGSNFESWDAATSGGLSNQTDALLKQYTSSTDPNVQLQAIEGIETIMVNDLPVLPLTVNPYWDEYTTAHFTGWPDASNPYALGADTTMPDAAYVILHLKPVS